MKENEKKQELLKGSRLILLMSKKGSLTVSCLGSFIDKTQYKITKITKASTITIGAKWEEIQKDKKNSKSKKAQEGEQW